MKNIKKIYPVPKFKTLEEEDKYWQSHSPLMEDYEGKLQKRKQKRASFISIRLTAEELAHLRSNASYYRIGPSTYARQLIVQGMDSKEHSALHPSLILDLYGQMLKGKARELYLNQLNNIYQEFLEIQKNYVSQMATLTPQDFCIVSLGEPESQEKEQGIKK